MPANVQPSRPPEYRIVTCISSAEVLRRESPLLAEMLFQYGRIIFVETNVRLKVRKK
jgi:hypothetical protein